MRRVSPRFFALVGFAALSAVPTIRASAQGTPPNSDASVTSESFNCDDPKTGALFTSVLHSQCVGGGAITSPPPGGAFTASAITDVVPGNGGSVHTVTSFDGTAGDVPVEVDATGQYFRYFTYVAHSTPVATIIFTSAVTASMHAEQHLIPSFSAFLEFGLLNNDNTFQSQFNQFGYDPNTNSTQVVGTIDVANDLNGATSFYYDLFANAHVEVAITDPQGFADIQIFDPLPIFEDANGNILTDVDFNHDAPSSSPTATPEPASLTLIATGLVGIAGFARRKRRLAAANA